MSRKSAKQQMLEVLPKLQVRERESREHTHSLHAGFVFSLSVREVIDQRESRRRPDMIGKRPARDRLAANLSCVCCVLCCCVVVSRSMAF